jgi:ankyrin repeat protein
MPELTLAQKIQIWPSLALPDVNEAQARQYPSISSNPLNDVLTGENPAAPLLQAASEGNNTHLSTLLRDPHWITIALQRQPYIRTELRPPKSPTDGRAVSTTTISNLERAVLVATKASSPSTVSLLLSIDKHHNTSPARFESRETLTYALTHNLPAVITALVTANPNVLVYTVDHKNTPLDLAIRLQNPSLVALLLSHAASHPDLWGDHTASHRLALAASKSNAQILTLLLLSGNYPVPLSGAIQTACSSSPNASEMITLLVQHGADVNEILPEELCRRFRNVFHERWTPLDYAAAKGREDVIGVLVSLGAREGERDGEERTAGEGSEGWKDKRVKEKAGAS